MSVAKSSLMFSIGTFGSRISGVLRESAIGAVFGASAAMDAFNIAFRIPNLLRDLLAEGALGSSFTKVFTEASATNNQRGNELFWEVLRLMFFVTAVISFVGVAFSPEIVRLMTRYEDDLAGASMFRSTVFLTRLMFPYIIFASLGAISLGALYQRNRYFLAAISPIAFNGMSILGALAFSKAFLVLAPLEWQERLGDVGILGLATGVLLGGAAQFLVQMIPIFSGLKVSLRRWSRLWPLSREASKVFVLMVPMVLASSAGQINIVVNTNFATGLQTGAVSWLNYAFRILQLPVGMFGVAVGAAVLPTLVRSLTRKSQPMEEASKHLLNGILLVLWLTLPCMIIMYFTPFQIIALLFQAGNFRAFDTIMTAKALQGYSGAVVGYGLIKVLTSFYYAVERTRYAMMISFITIAINYIGNAFLIRHFGYVGLAFTATLTLSFNALCLFFGVFVSGVKFERKAFLPHMWALLVASVVTVVIVEVLRDVFGFVGESFLQESSVLAIKSAAAVQLSIFCGVVLTVFGFFGLRTLRVSPVQALRMLRRSQ